jgi:hypothetical protein
MLLTFMMANVGFSAPPPPVPTIFQDPSGRIPGVPALGHPGEVYSMSINVADVTDVWAVQFTVKYIPFVAVLSAQDFAEGSFLSEGGTYPTMFNVVVDALAGKASFIIMRLPQPGQPRVGVSGSGVLGTLNFLVKEAGEGPIELIDTILLDTNVNEIPHAVGPGAFYVGTVGYLIRVNLPDGRNPRVGDVFTIAPKVRNEGDIPLYVRVRLDIHRLDDGRRIEIRSGQTYGGGGLGEPLPTEYFYVDAYRENPIIGGHEWTNEGDAMVGEPDGNYIEATTAYALSMFYSFEDLTLAGREVQNVDLFGYTSQPDGSTAWDFDPYVFPWGAWCDSMGGTVGWAWTGGRYYSGGPYDMPEYYIGNGMTTEAGFNGAEVMLQNYCPSGPRQQIDAMRWRVEFASITPVEIPIYYVLPGEELELGPITWPVSVDHIGSYELTATIEYSGIDLVVYRHYNSMGSPQKTLTFTIKP